MAYLKSECSTSNDENFVQDGETMKALTVTITLEEYRYLVREEAKNIGYINALEERLKKFEGHANLMTEMVLYDHPEFYGDMVEAVTKILAKMSGTVSEEESDTDEQKADTV